MEFLFDSRNPHFKKPFGCVRKGETLNITIYVKGADESGALFQLTEDGKPAESYEMKAAEETMGYHVYTFSKTLQKTGLFFYHFSLISPNGIMNIFKNKQNEPIPQEGDLWQITCYENLYPQPEETFGRVFYQIFPDRFYKSGDCDTKDKLTPFFLHENTHDLPAFEPDANGIIQNNDFFGGNLQGIIKRLPYLASLGIKSIYLNPVCMAYSNHRYDTADYLKIDPLLGTESDFRLLCRWAHHYGINIILDGVFSHTGSDSVYFDIHNRFENGACHNPDSPYRSWYQFHDYPHKYESWWGISTLPCTEERDPGFQRFIFESVIPYWLSLGANGVRLDVADELPEEFLQKLYATIKKIKPDAIVLGEVWEDASNKISYGVRRRYLQGKSLDSVMNYVWRDAIIRFARCEASAEDLTEAVMTICEHYPPGALHRMLNLLSTHDTPRILTVLGISRIPENKKDRAFFRLDEKELSLAKKRLVLAAFLLFCLPGCPCIYYGDEIGMEGFEDPFNRQYMGDTCGDDEIFDYFRTLSAMKNESHALRCGGMIPLVGEKGCFAFYRQKGKEKILCVVNNGTLPIRYHANGKVLFSKNLKQEDEEFLLFQYGCAAILIRDVT